MPKIKVMLAVSAAAAVVSWGLTGASLWASPLQGNGRTALAAVTITSTIAWFVLLRERRTDARLRQIEAEYRRREAVIIKTARLLAGAPPTGPQPRLRAVAGARR